MQTKLHPSQKRREEIGNAQWFYKLQWIMGQLSDTPPTYEDMTDDPNWTKGSEDGLDITGSGPLDKFVTIIVDGEE